MRTMIIAIEIPDEHRDAFAAAITGNDHDVILAAERAINDCLHLTSGTVRIDTAPLIEQADVLDSSLDPS